MSENNNKREYKYDAFISYRHTEPDKFVAEKIQKYLEEFKLPKNVKNRDKLRKTKIERVFRDKEELTITNNLEDPIIQALKDSEYLIVICSPRTKESIWCLKEIEKFTEFHGRNKILTVLIEGEPSDSFPDSLLYEDVVVEENGVSTVQRKEIEPLAADVRGKSKRQMCALIKTELLRVIAPMFGLEYDDLRQRHRERRMKKILTATVSAAALGITIGVAGIAAALVINNQKNEISAQQEKLLDYQADSLADKANGYLAEDRRVEAVKSALASVTEFEGIKMPYTAKGRYALTQATRIYDAGRVYKAYNQFITKTNITEIKMSPSRNFAVIIDKATNVYVWNVSGRLAAEFDDAIERTYVEEDITFVGEKLLAYLNNKNEVKVLDLVEGGEVFTISDAEYALSVKGDDEGKYLAVAWSEKIEVFDAASGESIYQIDIEEDKSIDSNLVWCGEKLLFVEDGSDNNISIVDISSKKVTYAEGDVNQISDAKSVNGYIYAIGGRFGGGIDGYGTVLAIDEKNGEVVWQNTYDLTPLNQMEIFDDEGEVLVLAVSYSEIYGIDGKTGDELYQETVSEGIADVISGEEGNINLLNYKGELHAYNVYSNEGNDLVYLLQCNVDEINTLKMCVGGFVLLPKESNYLIKYEKVVNEDREAYEVDDKLMEACDELVDPYEDYSEEAEALNINNPELVYNILYTEDKKVAFITYMDLSMEIYDVSEKKVINTVNDMICAPLKVFGKDKSGNVYIAGENSGYCFDKDYNLIGQIDDLKYVDTDKEYMVVGSVDDELWKLPIYSLDELVKKAKKIVE